MFKRVRAWWNRRQEAQQRQKAEDAAMEKYGWIGYCPHCRACLQTHDKTTCEAETLVHWHIRCGSCRKMTHWALYGMLPILDMKDGYTAWAEHRGNKLALP